MVDVIYSSDNVTVLGGPETLEVDLDIGATGTRGGLFFSGSKEVVDLDITSDFPTTPLIFDFYIMSDSASSNYLKVYQYVLENESLNWVESFSLASQYYYVNKIASFETGLATLNINLSEIGMDKLPFTSTENSFAYFNVQATVSNINSEAAPDGALAHNPCAVSVQVGNAYEDTSGNEDPSDFPFILPINLSGAELGGSGWVALDAKDVIVYLTISLANPNEIIANLAGGGS